MSKRAVDEWDKVNCHKCSERFNCFYENEKVFTERSKQIDKLGFCEEYVVDSSKMPTNRRQVCEEEITFNELFNKGIFPIYEGE